MPKGYPNPKPVVELPADAPAFDAYAPRNPNPPEAPQTDTVKLKRHYRPVDTYEIVGYLRPEIRRKTAGGLDEVSQTEEFIKGEMAPPPFPGVGYANKIWASTFVQLPIEEAKKLVRAGIAEREYAD